MSAKRIVRLRLRFAKQPGMTRTRLEKTSPSALIIPYFLRAVYADAGKWPGGFLLWASGSRLLCSREWKSSGISGRAAGCFVGLDEEAGVGFVDVLAAWWVILFSRSFISRKVISGGTSRKNTASGTGSPPFTYSKSYSQSKNCSFSSSESSFAAWCSMCW